MAKGRRSRRYVRAMLRAINAASDLPDPHPYVNSCTRTAGLRVIRDFERVNAIEFDPFNSQHVDKVAGMARFRNCVHPMRKRVKQ